jgi:hypothetical protein
MVEAKKRNPEIKLFTLAWTAPGWIGDGSRGPESQGGYYSEDNIRYHLNWIKGAKETHNLTLDYMGVRQPISFRIGTRARAPAIRLPNPDFRRAADLERARLRC